MSDNYHKDVRIHNTVMLRNKLESLPRFLAEYFRGIEDRTSSRTRINYANDFIIFFDYLMQNSAAFLNLGKDVTEFTLNDLELVTADDIEDYMDYLTYYVKVKTDGETINTQVRENESIGKSRKLSSLRSMFSYFYKKRKILSNPAELVDFPKLHSKVIVRLEPDEVAKLLDAAESGENLTKRQSDYHNHTKLRDVAILTTLLGTGMRVSECVGLNIEHIDFDVCGLKITRKGGKEAIVYFGGEVSDALSDYLDEREKIEALPGHESALFLSMQRKRLTDRAIQNIVKKYSRLVTTLKNISPHKLRSTYGTTLYNETNDIFLVANVLGHANLETAKKHYIATDDLLMRRAANAVTLRDDKKNETK